VDDETTFVNGQVTGDAQSIQSPRLLKRREACSVDRSMTAKEQAHGPALRMDDAVTVPPSAHRVPVGASPMTSQVVSSPTSESSSDKQTDVPSARPTSVPGYAAIAIARGAMTFEPHPNVPLAVPKRAPGADASFLPHAAAFVLMHVDGVSTVTTIAEVANLPLDEVVTYFLELSALGMVNLGDRKAIESLVPDSHIQRKRG
jgi:hypothetical protein